MKKILFTFFTFWVIQLAFGTVVINNFNQKLDSVTNSIKLDYSGDGAYDVTFNYFGNGVISVTGRIGNGNNTYFATGTISGTNNYPVTVGNNKSFIDLTTWKSNPIFIHSPGLGYTNFVGKGNQYIVGRTNFGGTEQYYFWILVNLNATGTQLNIIKYGYENEPDIPLFTGNEGASGNNTTTNTMDKNDDIQIFPMPASTEIQISGVEFKSYKIMTINGLLVQEENGITAQKINIAQLPKGIYLLTLLSNQNLYIVKKITIEN